MPYITKGLREIVDPQLVAVLDTVAPLDNTQEVPHAGVLNYIFTQLALAAIGEKVSYARINAVVGAFECAKLELYRRIAVPYENTKRAENGDVYGEDEAFDPRGMRETIIGPV